MNHGEPPRSGSRAFAALAARLAIVALALLPASALLATTGAAQTPPAHAGAAGGAASVPGLPPGDGRVVVEIVRSADGAAQPGVDIALYALAPDGRPGLASGVSDAEGRFAFENVSTEPGITYLAGAQFGGIPFGQRVVFEPGQLEQRVRIEVIEASQDGPPLVVGESRVQIGWLGRHLLFDVAHMLRNPGDTVRNVPKDARANTEPLFETALPNEFVEFAESAVGFANGLERDGTKLRFFGPVYPGQQEIRYRFTLAIPDTGEPGGERRFTVAWPEPMGSGRLTVLTPASGPTLVAQDPIQTTELELEGEPFESTVLAPVPAGGTLALRLAVPPARDDAEALEIGRADYWLDLDDALVTVRAQIQLQVEPGPNLQATSGAPLLRIDLPEGATLDGISTEAQRMGFEPTPDGRALELVGPVPPGDSSLEFGYSLPAGEGGTTSVDLRTDRAVPVLNVLVADNGVAVESDRLHRRRPFRQGTRNYLHRRAFQLAAGEDVRLEITPIDGRGPDPRASLAGIVVLAAGAVWFLVAPLQSKRRETEVETPVVDAATREREMIYQAIRDLDHDLDTGKIDAADHAELRAGLRAQAIDLVRRERAEAAGPATPPSADTEAPHTGATAATGPASFCTRCGGRVDGSWRFCSHCGAELPSA